MDGGYPDDVLADLGDWASCVLPGDEAEIAAPLDWLGVNYYNDEIVRVARPDDPIVPSAHPSARHTVAAEPVGESTDIGWPITPGGLTDLLVAMRDRYPALPPIYITENGAAYHDVAEHGRCIDRRRIDYLDAHLRAMHHAIAAGVDVRGYFAWSLMDNFEWAFGYSQRFGLIHVDYETQERTPKASYHWYAQVCRLNGLGE
jgi:beta-glucosidase